MSLEIKHKIFRLLVSLDDFVGDVRKMYTGKLSLDKITRMIESDVKLVKKCLSDIDPHSLPNEYHHLHCVSSYFANNLFVEGSINKVLYENSLDDFEDVLDLFNDSFDASDI